MSQFQIKYFLVINNFKLKCVKLKLKIYPSVQFLREHLFGHSQFTKILPGFAREFLMGHELSAQLTILPGFAREFLMDAPVFNQICFF